MKLFLDTAHVESIKKYLDLGVIDGITTNPSNLSKEGKNPTEQIVKICSLFPTGDISVEVTQTDPDALYKQAQQLAALAKNITVKIPCHGDYYPVIDQLVKEGVSINITLVFTLVQSLMMCKLGVKYISPFVGRWDDIDVDGGLLLHEIRNMIDTYGFSTQILAASLRHMRHLHEAITAGADVATISVALLQQSLEHPLTTLGMQKFNEDWKKTGAAKFPQE